MFWEGKSCDQVVQADPKGWKTLVEKISNLKAFKPGSQAEELKLCFKQEFPCLVHSRCQIVPNLQVELPAYQVISYNKRMGYFQPQTQFCPTVLLIYCDQLEGEIHGWKLNQWWKQVIFNLSLVLAYQKAPQT